MTGTLQGGGGSDRDTIDRDTTRRWGFWQGHYMDSCDSYMNTTGRWNSTGNAFFCQKFSDPYINIT